MMEEIKACPFQCVTLKAVSVETENGKEYYVECDCGARGPIAYSKNHAIEMWNAAANAMAKKDDEIEQLRKERDYWLSEYRRHVASTEKERDELEAEIEKWKAEYVRIHQGRDAFNRTNEEVFTNLRAERDEARRVARRLYATNKELIDTFARNPSITSSMQWLERNPSIKWHKPEDGDGNFQFWYNTHTGQGYIVGAPRYEPPTSVDATESDA